MSIAGLFLYCPRLSRSEVDEYNKIIAFYPSGLEQERQSQFQGIVEAISSFFNEFARCSECEVIRCRHLTFSMTRCETDSYLVIAVRDMANTLNLRSMLQNCLKMFQLFHPAINPEASEEDLKALRQTSQRFLDLYGPSIQLSSPSLDMSYNGISFFSVDRFIYCSLQNMINAAELELCPEKGRFLCVLYDKKLLWSCDKCPDSLYWLEQDVFASFRKDFCQDPEDLLSDNRTISTMVTWDRTATPSCPYSILVLRFGLLSIHFRSSVECCKDGSRLLLSLQLFSLHSQLRNYSRKRSVMEPARFLYFNGMNLAMKNHLNTSKSDDNNWSKDCFETISIIQECFLSDQTSIEIVLQSACSRWIVGKRFPRTNRVYFIVVSESFHDVDAIEAEIGKLENTTFESIALI
uniref:CCZ1/INTU/HSP4 first Longin domain-containing protein n=1 Tax=Spongospora subterranea TaxID=70186 RepID=A0A0H5RAH0_9EUKA|eukprot:CRZ10662.1 hypothetical protein [Spongospora subterranea]